MKKVFWFIFSLGALLLGAFFSLIFLGIGAVLVLIFSFWWRYKMRKIQKEMEAIEIMDSDNGEECLTIEGEFKREK